MKRTLFLLTILSLFSLANINAQTYPVISNTQVMPPYSVYLSDYAGVASDKLVSNLVLRDATQEGIQVKLRITITGENGVKLVTKPEFNPPPITMQGGVPVRLSGPDLDQYLNPLNMEISGINAQQFMRTKKLPEGVYQFTIEAVEYRRNKTVSNQGTAMGWLILNDPPVWNLPQKNALLTATYPQNIFFSWMPMHTASPNSAFTAQYEFSLYEIIPQTRNPQEATESSVPLYQTTITGNALTYGPGEPALEPGKKYVCRLKAYDTQGRDMFKNQGYSEDLVFTFGKKCKTPIALNTTKIMPFTADVTWTPIPGNTAYELQYREKKADGTTSAWYTNKSDIPQTEISQLKAERNYEYRVKGICGTIESPYSDIKQFSTLKQINEKITCDNSGDVPEIDGSPPLKSLHIGDKINAGGFEGRVIKVSGSDGTFSGKCIMYVPNFKIFIKPVSRI